MSSEVNPPRAYDGSRRRARASATRRRILDAARELFLAVGYAGTTVPAVAGASDVSVETVYKAFGNKPGLVKAVFDVALVGDDEPIAMRDRDDVRQMFADPDPLRKVHTYGRTLAIVGARTNPLLLVIRDAAASDPAATELWTTLQGERLTGMKLFAHRLATDGHLRRGVSRSEARDVLWAYGGVELWDLLVRQRHWSLTRYGTWLGHQLAGALLPTPPPAPGNPP